MTTPHSLITGRGTVAIDLCECAMKAISHATHIVPILPLHVHNTITRALRISDPILLNLFFRVLHLLSDCWDILRLLGPVYRLR
jgi:hypothetical protein